jgi:hypothetical protein
MTNCGLTSAVTAILAGDATEVVDVVNAIEVKWTLPYAIPNDRTFVEVLCKTE